MITHSERLTWTVKPRPPMTDRQRAVFLFIIHTFARDLRLPSIREIGAEFDIKSPNGVVGHLQFLTKKGYLVKVGDGEARSYAIAGLREVLDPVILAYGKSVLTKTKGAS